MNAQHPYVCPATKSPLRCDVTRADGDHVVDGQFVARDGLSYPITDGIPDLTYPLTLAGEQAEARTYYDDAARSYDDVAHLTFTIQRVDEGETRRSMVSLLDLRPGACVLDLACGTGRDSEYIAQAIGPEGRLSLCDISRPMLERCRRRLSPVQCRTEFCVANACHLPYPDRTFDAVFSFGGLGVFGDIRASLKEIVRVCRLGARVVVGDESMPPWLRTSEFGRILLNNNPLFAKDIPLEDVPVEARDVSLRWVINGVYYVMAFAVGEGEPQADFDLEIPGRRGGSLRTRYYGRLEGVSADVHALAHRARDLSGKSMHQWLDEAVRAAARKELGLPPGDGTSDE